MSRHLVLFDGECGFCNGAVRFILERDSKARFAFAPLQGEVATRTMADLGANLPDLSTMVLIEDLDGERPRVHQRSTAALHIARHLDRPWSWLRVLLVIPRPIRDLAYRSVAALRYRIGGRNDACALPKPEWRDRFLTDAA